MAEQPVLVEVLRGGVVESAHRGAVAVVDAAGGLVAALGDLGRPVFPRSAVKPLQALPLVETGAADRWGLDDRHLALASASHAGEPGHVELVAAWLGRLGLTEADLECGAHAPSDAAAARALVQQGRAPSQLHNNCSGKHAGFLGTARHLDEATRGYIAPDHPVQRRVADAMGEMMGLDMQAAPWGVDGCGIPTFAVPLPALAAGFARLAAPQRLGRSRQEAVERIRGAMAAHPWLVAGSGRCTTAVMQAAPHVQLKPGAEGVFAAALPARGLGVALKIEDGAGRAADVAMLAVLEALGALDGAPAAALADRLDPPLRNVAGRVVGALRPAAALRGLAG